jgi:hypothetical protein
VSRIPTLEEWLHRFGSDPRIKLIWLDVKVNVEHKLKGFVDQLIGILKRNYVTYDRVMFSVREVR